MKLFETNTNALRNSTPEKRKVPPAPILLHRSGSKMILKPAPFVSADGDSVSKNLMHRLSSKDRSRLMQRT